MANESTELLRWNQGEKEEALASLLPEEITYYVDKADLERCRQDPTSIEAEAWKSFLKKGGYYTNLVIAFAPPDTALEALTHLLEQDTKSYWPCRGMLAALGDQAVPFALTLMRRAVNHIGVSPYAGQIDKAVVDMAAVAAPELVPLMASVLKSKARGKTKKHAKQWFVRHRAMAAPILDEAAKHDEKTVRAAALAALKGIQEAASGPEKLGEVRNQSHHAHPLVLCDAEAQFGGWDEHEDAIVNETPHQLNLEGLRVCLAHGGFHGHVDVFRDGPRIVATNTEDGGLDLEGGEVSLPEDDACDIQVMGVVDVPSQRLTVALAYPPLNKETTGDHADVTHGDDEILHIPVQSTQLQVTMRVAKAGWAIVVEHCSAASENEPKDGMKAESDKLVAAKQAKGSQ